MKKIFITLIFSIFSSLAFANGHMQPNSFALTLKVPSTDVEKVEAILQSHHQFMHDKHSLSGDDRLNSYSIVKGFEPVDLTDPSKGVTDNVIYFLSEHYQTPTGLQLHGQNSETWEDVQEFRSLIYQYAIAIAFPGEVIAKMNR